MGAEGGARGRFEWVAEIGAEFPTAIRDVDTGTNWSVAADIFGVRSVSLGANPGNFDAVAAKFVADIWDWITANPYKVRAPSPADFAALRLEVRSLRDDAERRDARIAELAEAVEALKSAALVRQPDALVDTVPVTLVGGETVLTADYDDEVTAEQRATLETMFDADGMAGWEPFENVAGGSDDGVMGDAPPAPTPDTETVILDGRLWRVIRVIGNALVDSKARRLVELEEV